MSLFGGGFKSAASAPAQSINPDKIEQASNELIAVSQLYNAIQTSCYAKCINKKFYEGELTTGEGVCLDRCVTKFFATHQKMNEVLMQISAQQAGQ